MIGEFLGPTVVATKSSSGFVVSVLSGPYRRYQYVQVLSEATKLHSCNAN